MRRQNPNPVVAIACGGTGGHLFPGIAVGEELLNRGAGVLLLVSPKEIDQRVTSGLPDFDIITLPAAPLDRGKLGAFFSGTLKSLRRCRELFRERKPDAVLAMGGFTSAPAVLAGWLRGAKTFLHEANTPAGRANRWLAHFIDEGFLYFPEAARRLSLRKATTVGMPLRTQFQPMDASSARMALGLNPDRPVLLVMGGSQGAQGINDLVCGALPQIVAREPKLQFIHLSGTRDADKVAAAYKAVSAKAITRPFLTEMEMALGAASLAVSRSGASSLAEFAAMGLPAVLIPYPSAADNHQFFNARSFVESGAAVLREQRDATPQSLGEVVLGLLADESGLAGMRQKMAGRHSPDAAARVAERILSSLPQHRSASTRSPVGSPAALPLGTREKNSR
jgi:UDP-N-acetylglucosamine--N-acetylmuramyl-(pentapeptide) pyrophosphoryl-undecaprenol N-acetylglucosamine transferase